MFNFLVKNKIVRSTKDEQKALLSEELFRSAKQKKTVTQAARESAEDQRRLLEEYERVLRSKRALENE